MIALLSMMKEGSTRQFEEKQESRPIEGQRGASPGLVDRRRRRARLHAFEVHVPQKNNNKYDENT
jgi:hypothetical protein